MRPDGFTRVPPMKYAFNIPNFGSYADAAAVADLAAVAEQSGWDGFVVWDHIVIADGMPVGDPWVILTAVAMKTERIMIGPMVTPLHVGARGSWPARRSRSTISAVGASCSESASACRPRKSSARSGSRQVSANVPSASTRRST